MSPTTQPWVLALSLVDRVLLAELVRENGNLSESDLLVKLSRWRYQAGQPIRRQNVMTTGRLAHEPQYAWLTEAEWSRYKTLNYGN